MNPLAMPNTGYVPVNRVPTTPLETAQAPVAYPAEYVAPIDGLPILMQAQQPSCVGHGIAWAVMQKEKTAGRPFKLLSPRFVYALSKLTDGIQGDGTSVENALKVAAQYGVCEDEYFPNDVSLSAAEYQDASKITPAAYKNGLQHRISGYHFLSNLTLAGLKNAIYQNDIVIIGMQISDAWWTAPDGTSSWAASDILPLRPPKRNDPTLSNHCIDLYCYNDSIPLDGIMNWWSDEWGNKGTAFFETNDLPYVYEAAVINL